MWRKESPVVNVAKGVKGSGKTAWIIGQIEAALAQGARPSDMLVLAATPGAALQLSRRIEACLACSMEVRTPMQVAQEILAGFEQPKRKVQVSRAMLPYERAVFIEDMKATGLKPGRLKGMLGFFERCWMEARPSSEFLAYQDELELLELRGECFDFYGGPLASEIPGHALSVLEASPEAKAAFARRFVFVDDAQLLSAASQKLTFLLAQDALSFTLDARASFPVFEKHPHLNDGAWEEMGLYPDGVLYLEDPACKAVELAVAANPEEEIEDVVTRISQITAREPRAYIYVACPNKAWKSKVLGGLRRAEIPCSVTGKEAALACNVGKPQANGLAKAATLLTLLADPQDTIAWRALFGFDVHLANSAGVAALRAEFLPKGTCLLEAVEAAEASLDAGTLAEMLPKASGYALSSVVDIVERYRGTRSLLAGFEGLAGLELVAGVCKVVCPDDQAKARQLARALVEIASAAGPVADLSAEPLCAHLLDAALFPAASADAGVIIGDYAGITGLSPDYVFMTGAVEGFVVDRRFFDAAEVEEDRRLAELERCAAMVYQTVGGCAQGVVSSFEGIPAEDAELLGVRIHRIGVKGGKRVATAKRSALVEPFTA